MTKKLSKRHIDALRLIRDGQDSLVPETVGRWLFDHFFITRNRRDDLLKRPHLLTPLAHLALCDTGIVYDQPAPKPSLRTANLSVQAEYALYVGDETETPALPASKFQLQQAVRTAFWCRTSGRIVSISHNGVHYYYEVQLGSGRIVLEPEAYLTAAPELDATLAPCETRRTLTVREIEARMDTPDYDSGANSAYCQWNGIDQLNPDVR